MSRVTAPHRPWFKVLFNPILRRYFGVAIVSVVSTDGRLLRYGLMSYPKHNPIPGVLPWWLDRERR